MASTMWRAACVVVLLALAHCLPAPRARSASEHYSPNLSQTLALNPNNPAKEPETPAVRHRNPSSDVHRLLVVKKQPCVKTVDSVECDRDLEYQFELLVDKTKSDKHGKKLFDRVIF